MVGLLSEGVRQFSEPALHPVCLNVFETFSVYTGCTLVGATAGIGVFQNVPSIDLVVQGIEAKAGFTLRFDMQARNTLGVHAVLVEAKNSAAETFYRKYGFRLCDPKHRQLYLPLGAE